MGWSGKAEKEGNEGAVDTWPSMRANWDMFRLPSMT